MWEAVFPFKNKKNPSILSINTWWEKMKTVSSCLSGIQESMST